MSSDLVTALNRLAAAVEENNKLRTPTQHDCHEELERMVAESEEIMKGVFGNVKQKPKEDPVKTSVHDSKAAKYLTAGDSGVLFEIKQTTEFYADLVGKNLRYLTQLGKNSVFQDINNLSQAGKPMVYYLAADKTFVAKPTIKVSNATMEQNAFPVIEIYVHELEEEHIGKKFEVLKGADHSDSNYNGKMIIITAIDKDSTVCRADFNLVGENAVDCLHKNTLLRRIV